MADSRVVKVGGSLLEWPALGRILTAWLDRQTPLTNLVIAGGGELADQVRLLDQRGGLSKEAAHWLAIRAMDVNGFVLSRIVDGVGWTERWGDWQRRTDLRHINAWILSVERFLRDQEPRLPGVPVPANWTVTSDSIAARVAEVVDAEELVLLKSTLPESPGGHLSIDRAVADGFVDKHFSVAAASLCCIRAVNLRDAGFSEARLVREVSK